MPREDSDAPAPKKTRSRRSQPEHDGVTAPAQAPHNGPPNAPNAESEGYAAMSGSSTTPSDRATACLLARRSPLLFRHLWRPDPA